MATKAKEQGTADVAEPVKFSKEKILTFKRFSERVDLLGALLEDGREYTADEAAAAIENFMKGGK